MIVDVVRPAAAVALLFFLLATTTSVEGIVASPERQQDEARALLGFKALLTDPHGYLASWDSSSNSACNWTGVRCDELSRVTALELGNRNLSGPALASAATAQLAALPHLANLSLQQNNFSGDLSPDISRLHRLRHLNISHNIFSFSLPAEVADLPLLEILDAYNNNFSGPLPPELGRMRSIRHLHLGGSYFSGSIPPELGNLGTLEYLGLPGNSLVGRIPTELGNLTRLQELYLGYYNVFEGGIPAELGQLTNLLRLDLSYCGLNGPIPPQLGNLSKLDSLFLQINNISGPIPREIAGLTSLKSLDLSNNLIGGPVPEELAFLETIELVHLFRNRLEGTIPSALGDLPNLQVLSLWANKLSGTIPPQLGQGSLELKYVDLSSNNLTGSIPTGICQGSKLQVLILYGNSLDGPIPSGIGQCQSLTRVRLGQNQLDGILPDGILSLPNIQMLELLDNRIGGIIPQSPISAARLESLDLSINRLRGSIPPAIGNLTNMKTLFLSTNSLTGSLPASIGELKQLTSLDLSNNALSGVIPTTIGNCSRLAKIDLSNNQLGGQIPVELAEVGSLDALNLSRNLLTGKIPDELHTVASLTSADFSFNRLFGPVPSLGQFRVFNSSIFRGNPGLCGEVVGRNCTEANPLLGRRGGHRHGTKALYGGLIGAIFFLAFLIAVLGMLCFVRSYKVEMWKPFKRDRSACRPWKLTAFQKLDFSASDVVECLTEDNVIGRGGSGTVYKGMMPSGEIVAVKRLACPPPASVRRSRSSNSRSSHDDYGFSAEVQTLGKIRHMNIVKLLGFCSNQETNLLVYEYMPNGSLGEMIHGGAKKGSSLLEWETRYKIAVQAANGLCYLHHDCSPLIVHRDVKSNNILLDSNLRAHVADFGLAKLVQGTGKSESMSSIAGSYGYIAPEYAYTLKVNEKSDIYSFGVVLLELVTGRKPIEAEYGDGVDIVQWARRKIQTREGVLHILDARMGGPQLLPLHEAMLLLRVALLCSSDSPAERPTMRDVVQMLTDIKPRQQHPQQQQQNLSSTNNSSSNKDELLLLASARLPSQRLIDV